MRANVPLDDASSGSLSEPVVLGKRKATDASSEEPPRKVRAIVAAFGFVRTVCGSALDSTEQYLVQQCNCRTTYARGFARSVFEQRPWTDTYSGNVSFPQPRPRISGTPDAFAPDGRRRLGSIDVFPPTAEHPQGVINMYVQDSPGPPTDNDSAVARLARFYLCMSHVAQIDGLRSVAFPYGIGCGLARGSWPQYQEELTKWAQCHSNVEAVLYRLGGPVDPPGPRLVQQTLDAAVLATEKPDGSREADSLPLDDACTFCAKPMNAADDVAACGCVACKDCAENDERIECIVDRYYDDGVFKSRSRYTCCDRALCDWERCVRCDEWEEPTPLVCVVCDLDGRRFAKDCGEPDYVCKSCWCDATSSEYHWHACYDCDEVTCDDCSNNDGKCACETKTAKTKPQAKCESSDSSAEDESNASPPLVQRTLDAMASNQTPPTGALVELATFSYKRGAPRRSGANSRIALVDCRCLNNPWREAGLRNLSGEDERVIAFVSRSEKLCHELLEEAHRAVLAHDDRKRKSEGSRVLVAFGCRGGRHRSVAVRVLFERFLAVHRRPFEVVKLPGR